MKFKVKHVIGTYEQVAKFEIDIPETKLIAMYGPNWKKEELDIRQDFPEDFDKSFYEAETEMVPAKVCYEEIELDLVTLTRIENV